MITIFNILTWPKKFALGRKLNFQPKQLESNHLSIHNTATQNFLSSRFINFCNAKIDCVKKVCWIFS